MLKPTASFKGFPAGGKITLPVTVEYWSMFDTVCVTIGVEKGREGVSLIECRRMFVFIHFQAMMRFLFVVKTHQTPEC